MAPVFKPQFADANFIDLRVNTHVSITLTPTLKWAQLDKKLLYDHRSDRKLYTLGADDDTQQVVIKIDFGSNVYLGLVKLLGTNVKDGAIKISEDDVTYTTLYTISGNDKTSIHWDVTTGTPEALMYDDYLQAETGEYILAEDGSRIEPEGLSPHYGRYLKIEMDTTQIPNQEKYISELYVGREAIRLEQGRVIEFTPGSADPKGVAVDNYNNFTSVAHKNSVYRPSMIYMTRDAVETRFLRNIVENGGIFEFFPSGGDFGEDLDPSLSIDDVHQVVATGNWNKRAWGQNVDSIVTINLRETRAIV